MTSGRRRIKWNIPHQDDLRRQSLMCRSRCLGQVQLPGNAEAVAAPAEARAEVVLVQWHEDLTAFGEPGECGIQLLGRREVYEERDRRRKRERVLHVAVAEHQSMAVQVDTRHLHGALRARLAGLIPLDRFDANVGENRLVERYRFPRL